MLRKYFLTVRMRTKRVSEGDCKTFASQSNRLTYVFTSREDLYGWCINKSHKDMLVKSVIHRDVSTTKKKE